MRMPQPEELFALVREAGEAALRLRGAAPERKADGSEVSAADRESQRILLAGLARYGIPALSEETAGAMSAAKRQWVIDPLDGTADFLAGADDWCVMVGLLERAAPVMGVVYAPALGVLWSAARGRGSFTHDASGTRRNAVSAVSEPAEATMLMSSFHASASADAVAEQLGAKTRKRGSMGLKLGLIAEGKAEAYWGRARFGKWDLCAPHIILEEAGGRVTDAHGAPLEYGGFERRLEHGIAASNGLLHDALIMAARDIQ